MQTQWYLYTPGDHGTTTVIRPVRCFLAGNATVADDRVLTVVCSLETPDADCHNRRTIDDAQTMAVLSPTKATP